MGGDYRYFGSHARIGTDELIEIWTAEKAASRQRALAQELASEVVKEAIRFADEGYEREKELMVAKDILDACTSLFASDRVAAFTNPTCIDVFRVSGHPDQRSKYQYIRDEIPAFQSTLSDEQTAAISGLSDNEASEICDRRTSVICRALGIK